MSEAQAKLEIEIGVKGDAEAKTKTGEVGDAVNKTSESTKKAGLAFLGVGMAVAAGFGLAVKTAMGFETQMSAIQAVTGLTGDQMKAVQAEALRLGADTSFSASEAAAGMETLLKAGMSVEDVLAGGAQAALDLAAASGTTVEASAAAISAAKNVFGESAGTATDIANSFNAAANASAADLDSLAQGFAMSALPAQLMGMELGDLNTALALFSQNGLNGSDAGTSFKTMLMAMSNPSTEAKTLMDQLGISFFDAQGEFIGLEGTATELRDALSGMTEEQRMNALTTMFGADAVRAAAILYGKGAEGVTEMRDAMAGQGTAAEQAKARMDNLAGALETLKGSFETALILVGSRFTPVLKKVANALNELVNRFSSASPKTSKLTQTIIGVVGAVAGVVAAFALAAPVIGVVGAAFALIFSPVGLVIAALIGLGIAYRRNFLGFADAVDWVASRVPGALAAVWGAIIATKDFIVDAFNVVKDAITAVSTQFGFMEIIGAIFDSIGARIEFWKNLIVNTFALVSALINGDWAGAWTAFKTLVTTAIGDLVNIFTTDLATIWTTISNVFGGIVGLVQAIDWAALWQVFTDMITGIGTAIIDAWPTVSQWFVDLGTTILASVPDAGTMGSLLWDAGKAVMQGLWDGAVWVWDLVKKFWGAFDDEIVTIMRALFLPTLLWDHGKDILQGLWDGAVWVWDMVKKFWGTLGDEIVTIMRALFLPTLLWDHGKDIVQGLWDGAVWVWNMVKKFWGAFGNEITGIMRTLFLPTLLWDHGKDIVQGLWNGAVWVWDMVKKFWGAFGDEIVTIMRTLFLPTLLYDHGKDILQGLWDGIKAIWTSVSYWFFYLKDRITGAIPDLSNLLVDAGKAIIQGFWDGMKAIWGDVKDWVTGLADWVSTHKGPISYDLTLLVPNGKAIMNGLMAGMKSQIPEMESMLSGITASMPNLVGGATANAANGLTSYAPSPAMVAPSSSTTTNATNVTQTYNITVDVSKLSELTDAAAFVQALPSERRFVFGG